MSGLGRLFGWTSTPSDKPVALDLNLELVKEAQKWVGVHEQGGNNRGPEVERFQRAVDGKAQNEPWCLCFVQFCIKEIEVRFGTHAKILKSEHCMTTWRAVDQDRKRFLPTPGAIVIWRHGNSDSGHTGIVSKVFDSKHWLGIEGNTGPGSGVVSEGDGVYEKYRSLPGSGEMIVQGFFKPFLPVA